MIPDNFSFEAAGFGLDYRMNAFPRAADGSVLYRGDSEEEYLAYVSWLADYLYVVHLEPSSRQAALCEDVKSAGKEWAIQIVGMNAGLYDNLQMDIDYAIMNILSGGFDCSDEEFERIMDFIKRDREADAEADAKEDAKIPGRPVKLSSGSITCGYTREDVKARLDELRQEQELIGELRRDFCDVGWRVPLSVILRDIPDKAERIRLLRLFFVFRQEYADK